MDGNDSHLCVTIGVLVTLSQSQHRGVSHCHPVWLRPHESPSGNLMRTNLAPRRIRVDELILVIYY